MSKRTLWLLGIVLLVLAMVLSACGGKPEATADPDAGVEETADMATEEVADDGDEEEETAEPEVPEETPTPTVEEMFPETLFIHPEATDIEATPASHLYVYVVPGMVAETTETMLAELTDLGWETLGKPSVMGHLATITLQMDKARLTVSMQDNERSETTRVQMTLIE